LFLERRGNMMKKYQNKAILSILLLILIAWNTCTVASQSFRIESVYQTEFPKIRIVSSFDPSIASKYDGLQRDNFSITVDKQPMETTSFLPPRIRKEGSATVFLVDRSWSFLQKLDKQKTVLRNYVNKMDWNDQIAIIGFDDEVMHYLLNDKKQPSFSNDLVKITQAIDKIQPKNQNNLLTARYDAIETGIRLLSQSKRKNRYLVMISDDNRDEKSRQKNGLINPQQIQRIQTSLKQGNMQFFPLVMQDSEISLRDQSINTTLGEISLASGGKVFHSIKSAPELDKALLSTSVLTFPNMDVEGYTTFFLIHQDDKSTTSQWLDEIKKGITDQLHYLHLKDRFALIQENEPIKVLNNPYEIQKNIQESLTILNKTNSLESLSKGVQELKKIQMIRKYLIIVLPENQKKLITPEDSETIIKSFQENGISVCIISKGNLTQPFLSTLVRQTYGKKFLIQAKQGYEKGISDFYNWLYHTYTLEYASSAKNPDEENAASKVTLTVKKGSETFEDTFYYFPGVTGFRLPQNNNTKWFLFITALLLIIFLIVLLSFGKQKKRAQSASFHECAHCHKEIELDSLTCPYCGKAQYDNSSSVDDFEPTEYLAEDTKTRVIKKQNPSFAWITLLDTKNQGTSFSLEIDKNNTIGRDSSNTIVLDSDTISKKHAIIFMIGQDYFIQDCASQNSTKVNDQQTDRCQLHDNDLIDLGEIQFVFKQVATKKNPR